MVLMTMALMAAMAFAWIAHAVERRVSRASDHLSAHERIRRDRNSLKGFPWQYDVSARRAVRQHKER
jgi:hypothetical protein